MAAARAGDLKLEKAGARSPGCGRTRSCCCPRCCWCDCRCGSLCWTVANGGGPHLTDCIQGVGCVGALLPRCDTGWKLVGWVVGCLTSQRRASVSQGRICSNSCTCCHTEIEVADPTFYLTQSQSQTDTGRTGPNADPITPGAWQGSHRSANF